MDETKKVLDRWEELLDKILNKSPDAKEYYMFVGEIEKIIEEIRDEKNKGNDKRGPVFKSFPIKVMLTKKIIKKIGKIKKNNIRELFFEARKYRNKIAQIQTDESKIGALVGKLDETIAKIERMIDGIENINLFSNEEDIPHIYILTTLSPKMLPDQQCELYLIKFGLEKVKKLCDALVSSKYLYKQDKKERFYRGHLTTDVVILDILSNKLNEPEFKKFKPLLPLKEHFKETVTSLLNEKIEEDTNYEELYKKADEFYEQTKKSRPELKLKKGDIVFVLPLGRTRKETKAYNCNEILEQFKEEKFVIFGIVE